MQSQILEALLDSAECAWSLGGVLTGRPSTARPGMPTLAMDHLHLFRAGDRQAALTDVREWIRANAIEYMIISDPYFSIAELGLLMAVPAEVEVRILASLRAQRGLSDSKAPPAVDLPRIYATAWKQLTDLEPPPTIVSVVGTKSGKSPLHDRYILTNGSGLRLGVSVSSLGLRDTEVSVLSAEESRYIESEFVRPWLAGPRLVFQGERLIVVTFPLGEESD